MQSENRQLSREQIESIIKLRLAESLSRPVAEIDNHRPFSEFGLSSISAIGLSGELAERFNKDISPTIFWDYSNVVALADYIYCLDNQMVSIGKPKHKSVKKKKIVNIHRQNARAIVNDEKLTKSVLHNQMPEIQMLNNLKKQVLSSAGAPLYFVTSDEINNLAEKNRNEFINFSTYDYLGLACDEDIKQAAIKAIEQYGLSASASRLAGGEKFFHQQLEKEISEFLGVEDCVVMTSGHATNVTTIGHVMNNMDLILCDELSHNSILLGTKLSGATTIKFKHNNVEHLAELLEKHANQFQRVMIIIEGVYSMDGDIAKLPEIIHLKKKHNALLYIDEAHSLGVLGETGRGIMEHFHVDPADVDFSMGTLGKAMGIIGGYIAGKKELIDYLKYTTPGFVYSIGFGPAQTCGALASMRKLREHPELPQQLKRKAKRFVSLLRQAGLNCGGCVETPVVPVILGDSNKAIKICSLLRHKGLFAQAIIYPAVEDSAARIRFFLTMHHTDEMLAHAAQIIIETIKEFAEEK